MCKWTEQCQDRSSRYLRRADGYLVVNFKFLNHSKFHEHPQGCSNHGIHIKWEVIKMDVINAKLWHQRDVCCLKMPRGKGNFWFKSWAFFSMSLLQETTHTAVLTCQFKSTLLDLNANQYKSSCEKYQQGKVTEKGNNGKEKNQIQSGNMLTIPTGTCVQHLDWKSCPLYSYCSNTIYSNANYNGVMQETSGQPAAVNFNRYHSEMQSKYTALQDFFIQMPLCS